MSITWLNGAVIYQIYPRSFHDTAGNGTGDLNGITEKISYIEDLGVDGIWICPFFTSPMADFGYDVSDYRGIDPMFGTMDDFETLVKTAHQHDLKIIIDLVLSHTSIEHPWFHDPDKKDWYVWADPKQNGDPPNNWQSIFGGSAWEHDDRYNQYYMHNFLKEQPDLNYHNPQVQQEALNITKFWIDKGVDGFRLDTVNFYFHDQKLRDNPPSTTGTTSTQFDGDDPYSNQRHIYDKSQPENLKFVKKLRQLLDKHNVIAVGEIGDDNPVKCAAAYTAPNHLHTAYNLEMMVGQNTKLTPELIREPIQTFLKAAPNSLPSWAFSNHDVVRAVSRWNADPKMLIALLGCLYGIVFLYQGEELGLTEAQLTFKDLRDPWGIHLYPKWQGRDGCRTPIPWDDKKLENTWLPIPKEHSALSIQSQQSDKKSTLRFAQKFLTWRANNVILKYGEITFDKSEEKQNILKIIRHLDGKSVNCLFNLNNFSFQIDDFNP